MKNLFLIVGFIIVSSCNPKKSDVSEIEKLDWLIGDWENISDKFEMFEYWEKINYTVYGGKNYVFENMEHDFPQRIVYTNPKTDSIFAYIEGIQDDQYRKLEFPFTKSLK